jgi:hypothetical protein
VILPLNRQTTKIKVDVKKLPEMIEINLRMKTLKSMKLKQPDKDYLKGWNCIYDQIRMVPSDYMNQGYAAPEITYNCMSGHAMVMTDEGEFFCDEC